MDRKRLGDISEIRVGCLFTAVLLMSLPFLAAGTAMTIFSVLGAVDQAASNAVTRQVDVTITSSRVGDFVVAPVPAPSVPLGQRTPPGGSQPPRFSRGTGPGSHASQGRREFVPLIEFEYERAGQTETSDRFTPVGRPGSQYWAQEVARAYPPNSVVRAWLPDDPGRKAFLEKAWNPFVYAGEGAGVFAWAFCGGLLAVSGGWRWLGPAWMGAIAVSVGVLTLTAWAAWHAAVYLPVVPIWQAARVARALRGAGFE